MNKIFIIIYTCVVLSSGNFIGNGNVQQASAKHQEQELQEKETCQPDKLTVYKVVLHTFWSRDKFPKHYPDWRPQAQFSKVFGRSHDKSFSLFRLGQRSSTGVKEFAETGRSDLLEEQNQGDDAIYDEFNAPPISNGVGRTEAEFFVDGNHSRVSLISRIIPSPDWFIGIDSFDLCVNGNWLDSITIEVDPIDAGTDNGFTFTAPNWPTDPQGVVYRITSNYPSHPAGSFFYPNVKRLPAIGTFQFIKVKEYDLSEVFHHSTDDQHYEVLKMEHLSSNTNANAAFSSNNDIEAAIEVERQEMFNYEESFQKFTTTLLPIQTTIKNLQEETLATPPSLSPEPAEVLPKGDKDAILSSIVDSYRMHTKNHHRKKYHKIHVPQDCKVSGWSAWSTCSKSCGIGEMQRQREILRHARRGGQSCPPLIETKWCGSAQPCEKDVFNWFRIEQ